MSDLGQQQRDALKEILAKRTPVQSEAPTEVTVATEEPSKPVAQEVQTEQTTQEEVKPETTEVVAEPQSWDAEETPKPSTEAPKFDLGKIGSALNLTEIKSEDDVVAEFSKLKTKLKEIEEKPLEGVPEDFREVLEVAKKSGSDWRSYLAEQIVDYTKVDPVQLFEDEFYASAAKNPRYFTDGKFDEAKADEALDALPDVIKEQQGKSIQYAYIQQQRQRQAEIVAKTEQKRISAENSLAKATKNLNEVLPVESYGIKFEPKHSSEIYAGILDSTLTKKHLGGVKFDDLVKTGANMEAVSRTIALAEYGERMIKFKSQTAEARAGKKLLEKTQNAQIKVPGSIVDPSSEEKKAPSVVDKMAEWKKKQSTGLL